MAAPTGAGPWERELDTRPAVGTLGRGDTKLWTLLRATVKLHLLSRVEDVAAQVLDLVLGCLDADRVVVCRREPGINFQVLAQCGADPECLAFALEESRRLAQHEATAMAVDPRGEIGETGVGGRDRASVCVPIQRRARISGTIYAARSRAEHPFEARDLDFLRLLAAHAAIVLDNIQRQETSGTAEHVLASQPAASVQAVGGPTSAAASVFDLVRPLNLIERDAILAALRQHKGNRTAAAAALNISVRKLQYRIKEYQQGGFGVR